LRTFPTREKCWRACVGTAFGNRVAPRGRLQRGVFEQSLTDPRVAVEEADSRLAEGPAGDGRARIFESRKCVVASGRSGPFRAQARDRPN